MTKIRILFLAVTKKISRMKFIICLSFEEDDDQTETVALLSVNITIVKMLHVERAEKIAKSSRKEM